MNGIEKITARIAAEAAGEAKAALREASETRERMLTEWKRKADAEYDRLLKTGETELGGRSERALSSAAMDARKKLLSLKQEMVARAFDRSVEKICSLDREKYTAFLAGLAAKAAVDGSEILIFSASDKDTVAAEVCAAANRLLESRSLPGRLTVSSKTRQMAGGLVVKSGDIETNCSVEALVQQSRAELASQAAAVMFD